MKRKDIIYIIIITCLIILILAMMTFLHLKEEKKETLGGFNSELPEGKAKEIESSKSKAYEAPQADDSSKHIITLDEFKESEESEEGETEELEEEYLELEPEDNQLEEEQEQQQSFKAEYKENIKDASEVKSEAVDTVEEKPQKREFITATQVESEFTNESVKGIVAIAACIHQNQKVKDNGRIKIRVLEKFEVSGVNIDKGTILTGIAKIENDRVKIDITSIKSKSNIVIAKLSVYDNDGQEGIFYPASQEENALKSTGSDITKRIGSSIGTSGIIGSVVNGGAEYLSEKSSRRNIVLCADYKIFLIKL